MAEVTHAISLPWLPFVVYNPQLHMGLEGVFFGEDVTKLDHSAAATSMGFAEDYLLGLPAGQPYHRSCPAARQTPGKMALPVSTGLGLRPVPTLRQISASQGHREQEYATASRPLGNHRSLRADPQPHVLRPPGVLAWAGPGVALAHYRTLSGQSCPLFFSASEARREAIGPSLRLRVSRLPKTSTALVALDTLSSALGAPLTRHSSGHCGPLAASRRRP